MSAPAEQRLIVESSTKRAKELLQGVGSLPREDLEYVALAVGRMKDDRLKQCIAELIKWGDDERAELETLMAIGLEAMKLLTPSKLREAARVVELRSYVGGK